MTAPESTAPLEPPDPPLLEPESLLDVELSLERPESSPEPELPLDPELPEPTLESSPPAAPLEPELPPELGAPPEVEDAPPPELEDELVVSPEPHAQKDATTTETAKGASARVEVFPRTRGQRAVCTIHVAVASECASVNENRRGDEKTYCVAISSDGGRTIFPKCHGGQRDAYGSTYRQIPWSHMTATNTWCAPSNVTATLFGPMVSSAGTVPVDHVMPGGGAVS
jgi:hypothetical protein